MAGGVITIQAEYDVSLNKAPNQIDPAKPADDPLPAGDNITDWVPASGVWAIVRDPVADNLITPNAARLRSHPRRARGRGNAQQPSGKTQVDPATHPLWRDGPSYTDAAADNYSPIFADTEIPADLTSSAPVANAVSSDTRNTARFFIERMCTTAGPATDATCLGGQDNLHFRVTTRMHGPRNAFTLAQATFGLQSATISALNAGRGGLDA